MHQQTAQAEGHKATGVAAAGLAEAEVAAEGLEGLAGGGRDSGQPARRGRERGRGGA